MPELVSALLADNSGGSMGPDGMLHYTITIPNLGLTENDSDSDDVGFDYLIYLEPIDSDAPVRDHEED